MKIWTVCSSVLSQRTRLTDRQTDGQLDRILIGRPRLHSVHSDNKMLSYRRETALQGTLVLAESGRLELRDNILLIL